MANHTLTGTVTVDGSPAVRTVIVYKDNINDVIVGSTDSAVDGTWSVDVEGDSTTPFTVVKQGLGEGFDQSEIFNDVRVVDAPAPIDLITFEDPPYVVGTEMDAVPGEGWVEETSVTGQCLVSNSLSYAGTQSFETNLVALVDSTYITKAMPNMSTTFTVDVWVAAFNPSWYSGQLAVGLASMDVNTAAILRIWANDLYYSDNGTNFYSVTTGGAMAGANTWHHIEWQVNTAANNFEMWVDGTKYGATFAFWNNINCDRFGVRTDGDVGNKLYIDNLRIYEGTRV